MHEEPELESSIGRYSVRGVSLQTAFDEFSQFPGHRCGEGDLLCLLGSESRDYHYAGREHGEELVATGVHGREVEDVAEGSVAAEELVREDAETPHIDFLVVALLEDHLGSEVLGSAAHGLAQDFVLEVGRAEVCELESIAEAEDVLGFDVTMDDGRLARVEICDCSEEIEELVCYE